MREENEEYTSYMTGSSYESAYIKQVYNGTAFIGRLYLIWKHSLLSIISLLTNIWE